MHNLIRESRYQIAKQYYQVVRLFGDVFNNLSLQRQLPEDIRKGFQKTRLDAIESIENGKEIFSWALHDCDGRGSEFQSYDKFAWKRWLSWYRFHHFKWDAPDDPRIGEIRKKVLCLGNKTWKNLFQKYVVCELGRHDLYSLPDIYYPMSILGRMPNSTLDIGGGWGRLGMAWKAVGVKAVGITDSIEQPYLMQYQYLSAVPNVHLSELAISASSHLSSFGTRDEIVHFPLWHLRAIPSKSVEVASVVQVLREVNDNFIRYLVLELSRILVPNGLFYVRDNDHQYREKCMHSTDVTELLMRNGFELVLDAPLVQGRDIHGVPRVFRLSKNC